ncbi:MAG: hypothetical protein M3290_05525 [Actinomycetota bacterium]|nr:hypothetical protein [Actinomycetota bacterium]
MNWPLFTSGVLAAIGSGIHGIIGDRMVRSIDSAVLQTNRSQSGRNAKFLIRITWHFATIAFATLGIGLLWIGIGPRSQPAIGIAVSAGVLFSCWAALVVVAGLLRGARRRLFSHPAPLMLSLTAALIWWGLTRL